MINLTFIKTLGRGSLTILKYILLGIGLVLLAILSWFIIGTVQSFVFVPEDFIMWTVGGSTPVLALGSFSLFLIYLTNRKKINSFIRVSKVVKRHQKTIIAILLGFFIITGYYMFTNVSVISSDKIVTHGFFHPQGREYSLSDIEALHTGLYNRTIPFTPRQKGEFYYIVELKDGNKINLAEVGGIEDNEDSWLTFMELDQLFTELDVVKTVDAKDFDLHLTNLAPIYRDRIQNIFDNVK
ncbi:MAG: hypothetical protein JJT76_17575 [Clostridiaceae bacterium]|nr:hypothetical protein [Clostridiaceae bacterium]